MTPERWRRVTEVFHAALARDPEGRGALLDEACAGDSALRAEVDAMLVAHGDAGSGDRSPATASAVDAPRLGRGAMLGPYRIQGLAGVGGMGEVYRARDERLGRDVAIKVLPAQAAGDTNRRQRLEREARALATLSHPHICAVFDVGQQDGVDYLVMEYLEGETLARKLDHGALPLRQALPWAIEIASALHAAHRRGLVHRDLKPGNVMITQGGARLLDFGLARQRLSLADAGTPDMATPSAPLTGEGSLIGTLQYMAPEQLNGREADARTDIFAFGAVLYEMVTGRKAFEAKSQASLIVAILEHEPDTVSKVLPTSPPALDRLIQTCLAKDPEERWQSAYDLKRELSWIAGAGSATSGVAPSAAPGRGPRRRASALLGLAAVTAAIAVAVALIRAPEAPPLVRFSIVPPADVSLTIYGTMGSPQLALSPDGRYLAFVASRAGARPQLWLRALDSLSSSPLPGTEDASFPFWSPDSQSVGFFADRKLKRIDVSGARLQSLCEAPNNRGGAWGKDGTILFAPNPVGPIHRVAASGGAAAPVGELDAPRGEKSHRFPSFLPDGRRFLYLSRGEQMSINLGWIDAKPAKRLRDTGLSGAFVLPGHVLFVRERSLMAQRLDLRSDQLAGEPTAIADPVGGSTTYCAAFSASENGVLTYASRIAPIGQLTWFDRTGRRLETVGSADEYISFQLSPDQKRVAVTRADDQLDTTDLWLLDIARNLPLRLTHAPLTDASPLWSPDGNRIVYRSDRTATDELYIRELEGGAQEEALPPSPLQKFPTDWSPDGRIITFHSPGETGWDLWTLSLRDNEATPFLRTQFAEIQGRLAPSGRWMAYASDESGVMEVYVRSFPEAGDKARVSSGGGSEPEWRADGRELFYMASDRTLMSVPVSPGTGFEAGAPTPLFRTRIPAVTTPYRNNTYAASRDGQRFLVNTAVDAAEPAAISVILNWPRLLKP